MADGGRSDCRIALDAMGGDHAPDEVLKGAVLAVEAYPVDILLVGPTGANAVILSDIEMPHEDGYAFIRQVRTLGALEVANGYHELADAMEQGQRFERDAVVRTRRGDVVPPVDGRLLDALRSGLPDCAGVALGVDRLMMAMLGTGRIADVVAFDFFRA